MKTIIVSLAALLFLALSCSKDALAPANQDEALAFRKNATVPFHGVYTTYPVIVGENPPGVLIAEIPSEGHATHLGNGEWFSISLINTTYDANPETPEWEFLQTGEDMYFTAANGDQLIGDFSGLSIPGPPEAPFSGFGDFTITGGTGHFTGYSGEGTYHYSVVVIDGVMVGTLYWDGTLTKP